jgi:hypothetical protein
MRLSVSSQAFASSETEPMTAEPAPGRAEFAARFPGDGRAKRASEAAVRLRK